MGLAKTFAVFTMNEQFYKQQRDQQQQKSQHSNSGSGASSLQQEELPFDWVRRIIIGAYPRVACDSAYGSI